ncbi:MAG TPA: prepilin peptidase [bacterium]|nr:prepilin peptidase [bacterium]
MPFFTLFNEFLILFLPYFLIFLFGLFVGSFLNVVADRSCRGEGFLSGRSYCEFCKTVLKVADLVPVFSFLASFGVCRYCKRKLSIVYPLSEVLTGLMFVLALSLSNYATAPSVGTFGKLIFLLLVFSAYIAIFLADFKYQLIPNIVVIPATVFVGVIKLLSFFVNSGGLADFGVNLLTAFLLAGFFWILHLVTKGKGMGFGDVRLALLIGLFHNFPQNIVAIFGSFVIGAVFSLLLMLFGRAGMKTKIAFGPFMVISSVLTLVFGRDIVAWYTSLLFGL